MAFPSTNRLLVGDVQNSNQIWKQSLNARQNNIQQQIRNVQQQVIHSPIISKREVTGRRLDKERVYNPITCKFNSPTATRKDLEAKAEEIVKIIKDIQEECNGREMFYDYI